MDFTLKFSGELLVFIVALVTVICNLYFFSGDVKHEYSDNSHAAVLLSYHPNLNKKLYAKNTSIITTLKLRGGFVPQALAENLNDANLNLEPDEQDGSTNLNDGVLNTLSPDSINQLIAKQIKIYQTKSGDTLKSIAAGNGISVQTIMTANNLKAASIKPGWQLIILPTDGILHQMASNDTLPDLAKKYNPEKYNSNKKIRDQASDQLLNNIITYNALADAESWDEGQHIIIPGGVIASPPAATPARSRRDRSKVGGDGAIDNVVPEMSYDEAGHTFPKGYCTWYVAQKLGGRVKWGGNAKEWIRNSKAYGAVVDRDPAAGTILVTNDSRRYGHVAYVERVTDHGVVVSEMNYERFGKVSWREIPLTSSIIKGFIHP